MLILLFALTGLQAREINSWQVLPGKQLSIDLNATLPLHFECKGDAQDRFCQKLNKQLNSILEKAPSAKTTSIPISWPADEIKQALLLTKVPAAGSFGFYIKNYFVSSAYRFWIVSEERILLLAQSGQLANDPVQHRAQYLGLKGTVNLSGTETLVIEIQNLQAAKTEVIKPPRMLPLQAYEQERELFLITESLVVGTIIMAFLYHILLYVLRRSDLASLYLALFCLVIAIRLLNSSHLIEPPFMVAEFISYASMPGGAWLFLKYLQELINSRLLYISRYLSLFFLFLATVPLFLPVNFTHQILPVYQLSMLICVVLVIRFVVYLFQLSTRLANQTGKIILAASIILLGTVFNDILLASRVINSIDLTGYGLIAFVFAQGLIISRRNSREWEASEQKSLQLKLTAEAYRRFVPELFLSQLGKSEISEVVVGDQRITEMTIFFTDIRDYTTISENMTPQENIAFINNYLDTMIPCIESAGGFIDKFIGDAIMALFFTPQAAYDAARNMVDALEGYNERRPAQLKQAVNMGIGIHTGVTMLGTVGNRDRMSTTVISDAVNVAARLEALTKKMKQRVIVSEDFMSRLQETGLELPEVKGLGNAKVKGKSQKVKIYSLKL